MVQKHRLPCLPDGAGTYRFRAVGVLVSMIALATATSVGSQVSPKHDLVVPRTDGEVCVFCHVPNDSATSADAPQWISDPPSDHTFANIESLGLVADRASDNPGSTSLLCMSCHDGTQAPLIGAGKGPGRSEDHPVGVPYGGSLSPMLNQGNRGRRPGGWKTVPFSRPLQGVVDGRTIWWVETDPQQGRQKGDLFLPARENGIPYVECATCHDPHGTRNATFLRVTTNGSQICRACHQL